MVEHALLRREIVVMSQLPLYAQYLTAFSTPLIALMVAMIALAQWRTAHQRMVLDLFERRMKLIDEVSRIAATVLIEGILNRKEDIDGFLRATRGDKFLFGPEVPTYLQQTYKDLIALQLCETQLPNAQGKERDTISKNYLGLRGKLTEFHSKFHELVAPYVAMRQKLRWIDQIVG
jgi:hypothetical protein